MILDLDVVPPRPEVIFFSPPRPLLALSRFSALCSSRGLTFSVANGMCVCVRAFDAPARVYTRQHWTRCKIALNHPPKICAARGASDGVFRECFFFARATPARALKRAGYSEDFRFSVFFGRRCAIFVIVRVFQQKFRGSSTVMFWRFEQVFAVYYNITTY